MLYRTIVNGTELFITSSRHITEEEFAHACMSLKLAAERKKLLDSSRTFAIKHESIIVFAEKIEAAHSSFHIWSCIKQQDLLDISTI
ncbi:hypothetical protein GJU40_01900 [Bacillus lacus]|uniref:Uncharacterized protein n=1 Tax=Metabacillus lacus TaxID=1983721 RepID=A0A7X2IW67_9BACI|nr:hypothetical protein [Metabacillus lacus]MRX70921.1 hypothetical protein [Metabacillus lacus]